MITWTLACLLIGFVLSWIGAVVFNQVVKDWRWELVAVLCWPLVVLFAIVEACRKGLKRV